MAFSATLVKKGIIGDMAYSIWTWTAGGDASGYVHAGVGEVYVALPANSENYSEDPKVEKNVGSTGTVRGDVKLTFADSTNNTGTLFVLGKAM